MLNNTEKNSDSTDNPDSIKCRSKQYSFASTHFKTDGTILRFEFEDSISSDFRPLPCDTAGADSISIVVVNHNAGSMLTDCINSAMNQADEIIVVDNASSDDSVKTLKSVFPNNTKLTIIKNKTNLGFAKGCNIGSRAAKGKYYLFLNPDCLLEKGSVEKLIACLKANPEAAVYCSIRTAPNKAVADGRCQHRGDHSCEDSVFRDSRIAGQNYFSITTCINYHCPMNR